MDTPTLKSKKVPELKEIAKGLGLKVSKLRKQELINSIRIKSSTVQKEKSPMKSITKSPIKSKSPKKTPKSGKQEEMVLNETFIDKIGPPEETMKYGLITPLGSGKYGDTYKAKNLVKGNGEDDYYVIKILKQSSEVAEDWIKEVLCLIDVMKICKDLGILCYVDSFIIDRNNTLEFVIITEYLEGYQDLADYLFNSQTKVPNIVLSEKDALNIYRQVVDVKNRLNDLCISHSDLHAHNIMYNPKTKKIKVIDLGRCQTPQEEINEWNPPSKEWNTYSDVARLYQLKTMLYNSVKNSKNIFEYHTKEELNEMFKSINIDLANTRCLRVKGPRKLFRDQSMIKNR